MEVFRHPLSCYPPRRPLGLNWPLRRACSSACCAPSPGLREQSVRPPSPRPDRSAPGIEGRQLTESSVLRAPMFLSQLSLACIPCADS